jgi:hypothetical protein
MDVGSTVALATPIHAEEVTMGTRRSTCVAVFWFAGVLAVACGGASNSQVAGNEGDGGGGNGGSSGSTGSSGGSGGTGGSGSGSGSSSGVSASSSGSSSGGTASSSGSSSGASDYDGGACEAQSALTVAANISINVTWPATTAGNSGSGTVHVWLLAKFTANGDQFTGSSQTCGLSLPDLALNGLGAIAAGGSKVQITIPASVWSAPSMPTYDSTGSQTGWGPPSTFTINPTLALIGLTLPSGTNAATYAWPSSSWDFPSGTTYPDSDGDGNPGITASPLSGNGYVYPPTAIGLGGSAPSADQVYLATRTQVSLNGNWTSCTDLSGTADVSEFNNHVVGCHIHGGSACTTGAANTQADFIDQNRTVYAPGSATFVAKTLSSTGTCADALSAVP